MGACRGRALARGGNDRGRSPLDRAGFRLHVREAATADGLWDVLSNIAFQGAKVHNPGEKKKIQDWIIDFEYNYNKIPVPDMNIFLDVPFEFVAKQLSTDRAGEDRKYLLGNRDIHEDDLDFQKRVREMYLSMSSGIKELKMINCSSPDGNILSPEMIFQKILKMVFN